MDEVWFTESSGNANAGECCDPCISERRLSDLEEYSQTY